MNPETLAEALQRTWERWPEQTALVFGQECMSYDRLATAVTTLARAYRRLGVGRGDRIVCSLSNQPQTIIALGAAWLCGAVHVGVDYQFTAPELSAVIALTQAHLLLYEPVDGAAAPFLPLQAIRQHHPDIAIAVAGDHLVPAPYLSLSGLMTGDKKTESRLDAALDKSSPEDAAMIFVSSGTTGKPKAALGFHGNLCQRWQRLGGWLRFSPEDVHLVQMPLSHGFGLMMAVAALLTGGRLVLLRQFSAEEALQLITEEQVTVLNGAPAHFKLILNRLDPARHRVQSLRLSVGTAAAFPPPLVQDIWERLGVDFMFMYGSSEGVGVATTDREDILLGSVGRPAPGSVAIVGPDRTPLPCGEVGEVAFSRQTFPVRYWRPSGSESPSTKVPESKPTWYYSGDLGRLDEEGRLYVFGRLKHQIDRGGLKVDPVEVEGALMQYAQVADAAVIGLPNPILGEMVCACVVPAPGAESLELEQLRAMLEDKLAPYKLPEVLYLLPHIPRTQIGKVNLVQLRTEVKGMSGQALR